ARGGGMVPGRAMSTAQGGDVDARLPEARHVERVRAEADGVVAGLDAMAVGVAACRRGAGRSRPGEAVQAAAGVEITRHIGEQVRAGDVLARLHTDTPERIARAAQAIDGAWALAAVGTVVPERRIVLARIA